MSDNQGELFLLHLTADERDRLSAGVLGAGPSTMDFELSAEYQDGWDGGRTAANSFIAERLSDVGIPVEGELLSAEPTPVLLCGYCLSSSIQAIRDAAQVAVTIKDGTAMCGEHAQALIKSAAG